MKTTLKVLGFCLGLFLAVWLVQGEAVERFIRGSVLALDGTASLPTTCVDGQFRYDTTSAKLVQCNANTWAQISGSGGGGLSYFDDLDADTVSNVTTYDDGASTPTDGTGGTVNYASTSSETSAPLVGDASYKLSKSANNAQGEGWAVDSETLDSVVAGGGSAFWVQFYYKTSANYAADEVKVYAYRAGSNTLESLNSFQGSSMSNSLPVCSGVCEYAGWLTASSSDTSIRLIFHIAGTAATAYDITVDRIRGGPSAVVQSGIMGDWQSYTPTWTNLTVGNAIQTFKWRRVGDSMEISGHFEWGSTTSGSGTFEFSLPNGYSVDNTKARSPYAHFGTAWLYDAGVGGREIYRVVQDATNSRFYVAGQTNAGTSGDVGTTFPFTWATGDELDVLLTVPISGWTSGNVMSTAELQVRSAVANYSTNASQTISTGTVTIVDFEDKITDTHNAVTTGASWKFTAPSSGNYLVASTILFEATTGWAENEEINIYVYKNGIIFREMGRTNGHDATSAYVGAVGTTIIPMVKGDYFDIRALQHSGGSLPLFVGGEYNHVSIAQLPDLTVVGVNSSSVEIINNSSSTKTPSASAHFHSHTNNSLTLTAGTWELLPSRLTFSSSGGTAAYTSLQGGWSGANGGDNGTFPTALKDTAGITVLTTPSGTIDFSGRSVFLPTSGVSEWTTSTSSVIIRVSQTVTVYLNSYADMTTPANARITVYPNAKRLQ